MMDEKVFNEFRTIVYKQSGISLADNKTTLVCARINKRLRALGIETYEEYLKYLKNDPSDEEIINFLDVISTNTTNFFREATHFDYLAKLLEEWAGNGQRRFRIWCAASSSGEEPYTIAMTVRETLKDPGMDIKILATDISTKILAHAQNGVYDEEKIDGIPKSLLTKYFIKTRKGGHGEGHTYEASDDLKKLITFRRLNLSIHPFPMKGPLDVVLCRNVMIYFDHHVRQGLVEDIERLLKPGGYLMVGHSESLTGLKTGLKTVRPAIYIKN